MTRFLRAGEAPGDLPGGWVSWLSVEGDGRGGREMEGREGLRGERERAVSG